MGVVDNALCTLDPAGGLLRAGSRSTGPEPEPELPGAPERALRFVCALCATACHRATACICCGHLLCSPSIEQTPQHSVRVVGQPSGRPSNIMAARRDEPTRVAPYGAPGTRAICDSSIVPLGLRGPFLNALRVDQSDLKQALILGRPRDPCKNTRGAHLMLTRATLARLTAPRTLSLRDPRECGDLALDRRGPAGRWPRVEAAAQQDEARRRPRRGGLDETANITPEALFDNRRTLDGQELRVNAPRLARRESSRSDAERRAAMRAKLVGLSKRGSRLLGK
ncbi:unnamed protein product [Pelagomonas calceolata]|uniref:Uncharacterized protein n=2 Tax=Pelagomonas calceolata TaxID=35677 RepID=A0A8J2X2K5_9STRA|nr:unnamed protein product [Pelagomonas calceolata]